MNLKPLGDRVILKQDEAEVTTASGLFLALSLIHISEPTRH